MVGWTRNADDSKQEGCGSVTNRNTLLAGRTAGRKIQVVEGAHIKLTEKTQPSYWPCTEQKHTARQDKMRQPRWRGGVMAAEKHQGDRNQPQTVATEGATIIAKGQQHRACR